MMEKRKLRSILCLTVLSLIVAPVSFGGETAWDWAEEDHYGHKAAGMVGRGLVNVGTCPLDTFVHTIEGTQQGPPVIGTLGGLGSGLGCTLLRALSGVLDVATFWVPGFNGAPVSRSYSDCLDFGNGAGSESATDYSVPSESAAPVAEPTRPKHDPMAYVKK